jgi:hypothetical protein
MVDMNRFPINCNQDLVITDDGRVLIQERGSPWIVRELDDVETEGEDDENSGIVFPCYRQLAAA